MHTTVNLSLSILALVAFLLTTPSTADAETIWLANGEDYNKVQIVCWKGRPVKDITLPIVDDHVTVAESDMNIIKSKLEVYFNAAGLGDFTFTTTKPENPSVTVYFQSNSDCAEGVTPGGVDRFNETKSGEIVVIFADVPGQFVDSLTIARTAAHEIGHTLGLSHILPTALVDPFKESLMDNRYPDHCGGGCSDDRFLDRPIQLKHGKGLHSPQYHLSRYVAGITDEALQQSGICPGDWELPSNAVGFLTQKLLLLWLYSQTDQQTSLEGGGKDQATGLPAEIYDLSVVVDSGNHLLDVVHHIEVVDTGLPLELSFEVSPGMFYQVFASTTPGGEPDILFTTGSAPGEQAELFPAGYSRDDLILGQVTENGFESLANVNSVAFAEEIFADNFEGEALEMLSLDALATLDPSICVRRLTIEKVGDGMGTVANDGVEIDCGPECDSLVKELPYRSEVSVTATPESGYGFVKWDESGACGGSTDPKCTMVFDFDQTARPFFGTLIADLEFDDAQLQTCVNQEAANNSYTWVHEMTSLICWIMGIASVEGIQQLEFLNYVSLYDNALTDVTPLGALLDLDNLNLGTNSISNIEPLASLAKLRYLYLSFNPINNLPTLNNLTNLGTLDLHSISATDFSPVSALTQLQSLDVGSNNLSSISFVSPLTNLQVLYFDNNQVGSITPLAGMTKLTYVGFQGNQVSTIDTLAGLTGLQSFSANDNVITNISVLGSFIVPSTYLDLSDNQISDIGALSGWTHLESLDLGENLISNVSVINGLNSVTYLLLDRNPIANVVPLGSMTQLEDLDLSHTEISDVSSLTSLVNLDWLNIGSNNGRIPCSQQEGFPWVASVTADGWHDSNGDGYIDLGEECSP